MQFSHLCLIPSATQDTCGSWWCKRHQVRENWWPAILDTEGHVVYQIKGVLNTLTTDLGDLSTDQPVSGTTKTYCSVSVKGLCLALKLHDLSKWSVVLRWPTFGQNIWVVWTQQPKLLTPYGKSVLHSLGVYIDTVWVYQTFSQPPPRDLCLKRV